MIYYITGTDDKLTTMEADGHNLYKEGGLLILYKNKKQKHKSFWQQKPKMVVVRDVKTVINLNCVKFVEIDKRDVSKTENG
jgi:hypothetical protein